MDTVVMKNIFPLYFRYDTRYIIDCWNLDGNSSSRREKEMVRNVHA